MYLEASRSEKRHREKLYKKLMEEDKFIATTNYHSVMNDYDTISKLKIDMVVIDEVHSVKNKDGVMNKAIGKVCKKVKKIIFLTGTPIMSKPDDLFGIIQIADKKYFGKWKDFHSYHIKEFVGRRFVKTVGYMHLNELRNKVQNIIIRRTEYEVDLELPNVIEKEIIIQKDHIQKEIDELISNDRQELSDQVDDLSSKRTNDKNKNAELNRKIELLEGSMKGLVAAQQAVANDPRLFSMSKSGLMKRKYAPLVPNSYERSNKIVALLDLIEDILDSNGKVVIFTKFERCCRLIKMELDTKFEVDSLLYTGDVNEENRNRNVELFKTSSEHNILILTEAGSEGINLQISNHVINFDLAYTPAIMTQRMGRIRRAGSNHKRAYVYNLLTEDSFDIKLKEELKKKALIFDGLVNINEAQSDALKEATQHQ